MMKKASTVLLTLNHTTNDVNFVRQLNGMSSSSIDVTFNAKLKLLRFDDCIILNLHKKVTS